MKSSTMIVCIMLLVIATGSIAQIPRKISYQGVLTSSGGVPVPDGAYQLQFDIYNLPAGGLLRHTETHPAAPVQRGAFHVILGTMAPLTLAFDESLYVELTILSGPPGPGYPLVVPRITLTATPYALNALTLLGPGSIATGQGAMAAGTNNRARGKYAVVSGGGGPSAASDSNSASGQWATIGGGRGNSASDEATIAGGMENHATGQRSAILGGNSNTAIGFAAVIGGGESNIVDINGNYAVIVGGMDNECSGDGSAIVSGGGNSVTGHISFIGGGDGNSASGNYSTIAGGTFNQATGRNSSVSGGMENQATGSYSAVPGGNTNKAAGVSSLAAGSHAQALHDGSFVWADSSSVAFSTTAANQFLIRASGGVGIGTNSPKEKLDVDGNISLSGTHLVYNSAHGVIDWGDAGTGNLFFRTLATQGDENTATERMIITNDGNIGIGTVSPSYRLTISDNTTSPYGMFVIKTATGGDAVAISAHNAASPGSGSVSYGSDFLASSPGSGQKVGVRGTASGAGSINFGGVFRANGGTTNYGLYVESGLSYMSDNVGIGVLNPSNAITLPNNANSTGQGLANAWNTYSSRRWKTNIETIESPLKKIARLRGVSYDWKESGIHDIGLIAEEVGEVIPEIVQYEENGKDAKSVDYARLVALLIEGMKEQQKKIENLEAELTSLKNKKISNEKSSLGELR